MDMKTIKLKLLFLSAIICLLFSGCETPRIADGQSIDAAGSQARQVNEYSLGAGDQIRLIVFGEENLSGEFVVDGGGSISLPLIGEIAAKDKTIRQFQRSVELALQDGYLNDPRVSAEVLNFRPYYILGEVASSGEYPFSDGLTVVNAVATAGGFTYRANKKVIFIKRAGDFNEVEYPLTSTTPVQPGDTIRISERLF